jgi:hypothetical protein
MERESNYLETGREGPSLGYGKKRDNRLDMERWG